MPVDQGFPSIEVREVRIFQGHLFKRQNQTVVTGKTTISCVSLKITSAKAAGVTSKLWEMSDMVDVLETWEAAK